MSNARRGVTLVEMMVVLVLLGLMAGVVGLAWRRPAPSGVNDPIRAARHQALTTGAIVRVDVPIDGRTVTVAALPDGSILAPDGLRVDPLTGRTVHGPQ